jgi:hypothetical protein
MDLRNGIGCGEEFAVYQPRVGDIIHISIGDTIYDIYNMQLMCHKRKTRKINRRGSFESIRIHRHVPI